MHLFNLTVAFGHRAILIWGVRGMAGSFLLEQPETYTLQLREVISGPGKRELPFRPYSGFISPSALQRHILETARTEPMAGTHPLI